MSDEKDILIELFKDQMIHARHHEQLRATVSNIIITISGVIIGFIIYDKSVTDSDAAAIIFLILLGVFGAVISMKHYQHLRRHQNRAEMYRDQLEKMYEKLNISQWLEQAYEINKTDFPLLYKIGLHKYWLVLHLMIMIIGVYLLYSISCS